MEIEVTLEPTEIQNDAEINKNDNTSFINQVTATVSKSINIVETTPKKSLETIKSIPQISIDEANKLLISDEKEQPDQKLSKKVTIAEDKENDLACSVWVRGISNTTKAADLKV